MEQNEHKLTNYTSIPFFSFLMSKVCCCSRSPLNVNLALPERWTTGGLWVGWFRRSSSLPQVDSCNCLAAGLLPPGNYAWPGDRHQSARLHCLDPLLPLGADLYWKVPADQFGITQRNISNLSVPTKPTSAYSCSPDYYQLCSLCVQMSSNKMSKHQD